MAHPLTKLPNIKFELLDKELAIHKDQKAAFDELFKAYNDDFWQDGNGSLLPPPRGSEASLIAALFKKRFVSRNVIKECVSRVSGAFYGKAPNWSVVDQSIDNVEPVDHEKIAEGEVEDFREADELITAVGKALGDFFTKENISSTMADAFESRLVVGRGGIRIYIPAKYNNLASAELAAKNAELETEREPDEKGADKPKLEQPTISFPTIEAALNAIKVEYVSPEQSRLLDDDGELFSIVKYKRRKDWSTTDTTNVIEFSFVDNDGDTYVGVIHENDSPSGDVTTADLSSPLKLGGRTSFNEFRGPAYVTPGLYKNNQLLNLALTCSGFALVDNGFSEVFFTNVETEMEEVSDPTAEGGTRLVPKNIKRGGGMVQNLVGISTEDEDGNETRQTPGVTFREPSQLTAFVDGKDLGYTSCLEEAGQLYAKISGDATASGESRIQAMTDFWLRIRKYKPEVDEIGGWVMTTVLKLASMLVAEGAGKYDNIAITYDSKVFIGPVSASERDLVLRMRDAGVISRETAAVLLGVEDPELENELILNEAREMPFATTPADFDKKLDIALKMQGIFPQDFIFRYLGVTDPDLIETLKRSLANDQGLLLGGEPGLGPDGNPLEDPESLDQNQ